jgi:catechol 2,3-dioxygenase-like lactoylglutathione lyase family enzyme
MLKPIGMTEGHYECRSLDETLPIFTDLLAAEIVERTDKLAVVKHPNTAWRLVIHEGGPNSKNKPHTNHYGFRVATSKEVPRAHEYITEHKAQYKIKSVTPPHEAHFAYSIYFKEPGGNDLEIEYYNPAAIKQGRRIAAPHWSTPIPEEKFPGKGYVPQAMTHGTMECINLAASIKFYKEGLGLDVITHVPAITPHDVKHPATPWYVVSLEVPAKNKHFLTPLQRYTVAVESAAALVDAHREFSERRAEFGLTALEAITETPLGQSFLLSDLDHNWWEITAP